MVPEHERNPYGVTVGQVWRDRDVRYGGRLIRITALTGGLYARTVSVDETGEDYPNSQRARRGRVALQRFHRFTLTQITGADSGQ